jgi:hypothetical protein
MSPGSNPIRRTGGHHQHVAGDLNLLGTAQRGIPVEDWQEKQFGVRLPCPRPKRTAERRDPRRP